MKNPKIAEKSPLVDLTAYPPGKDKKIFYLKFNADYFNKGDIIKSSNSVSVRVIKTYKLTWWRKLLLRLGLKVKFHEVKVINNHNEK